MTDGRVPSKEAEEERTLDRRAVNSPELQTGPSDISSYKTMPAWYAANTLLSMRQCISKILIKEAM